MGRLTPLAKSPVVYETGTPQASATVELASPDQGWHPPAGGWREATQGVTYFVLPGSFTSLITSNSTL